MNELEKLRQQIDQIDDQLLVLIQKRVSLMRSVGDTKKFIEKPIRDLQREDKKIGVLREDAHKLGLPVELIMKIWNIFFEASGEIEK